MVVETTPVRRLTEMQLKCLLAIMLFATVASAKEPRHYQSGQLLPGAGGGGATGEADACVSTSELPQFAQNRVLSARVAPHFEQVTIPAFASRER